MSVGKFDIISLTEPQVDSSALFDVASLDTCGCKIGSLRLPTNQERQKYLRTVDINQLNK